VRKRKRGKNLMESAIKNRKLLSWRSRSRNYKSRCLILKLGEEIQVLECQKIKFKRGDKSKIQQRRPKLSLIQKIETVRVI
jgi:hypothetical protein